jgi:hypothetical protein
MLSFFFYAVPSPSIFVCIVDTALLGIRQKSIALGQVRCLCKKRKREEGE